MGFPGEEYYSGLPYPAPGNLPNPWIEPSSPALAGGLFTIEPLGQYGYQRGISEVTTEQRWLSLWPTASVVNSFIPLCFLSWSILHLDSQDYVLKLPLDCKSRDNRAGAGSSACPIFLSFIFVGLNWTTDFIVLYFQLLLGQSTLTQNQFIENLPYHVPHKTWFLCSHCGLMIPPFASSPRLDIFTLCQL